SEIANRQTATQATQSARDLGRLDFGRLAGQEDTAQRWPRFVQGDRHPRAVGDVAPPGGARRGGQPHDLAVPLVPDREHVRGPVGADAGELGTPEAAQELVELPLVEVLSGTHLLGSRPSVRLVDGGAEPVGEAGCQLAKAASQVVDDLRRGAVMGYSAEE